MTNKEKYKKVFDVLASSEQIFLEVDQVKSNKKKNKRYGMKNVAAAIAACVILAVTGTGVYAAVSYYGIFDFADRTSRVVPKEAEAQIQKDIEITQEENNTIFQCSVKEALCDSQTITLVYEVSAKDADKYLFIPEDALPEDMMSNWSNVTDKTTEEYASENNLTIVNIGGGIMNCDELKIVESTMDFLSVSDDVMDIFITSGVTEKAQTMNIDVVATGRVWDSEEVMRLESKFELQDMSTTTTVTYTCKTNEQEGQFFKIEKAEVTQTELGTYVDVYYRNEKAQNEEDRLTFRIVDQSGNEYKSTGSSGVEWVDDNLYRERYFLNKCEIGETLNIEAFDCYEKNVYGVTELTVE